jgi:hypothetical protein
LLRCLAETEEYRRCCERVEPDAPRLDEALRYPLKAIAEHPENFPLVPKTNVRRAKTNGFPNAPAMIIFFRVVEEDSKCELLWIEPAEEDDMLEQLTDISTSQADAA